MWRLLLPPGRVDTMDAVTARPPKGYAWGAVTIQTWALVDGERVVTPTSVPALMHACGYLCLHKPVVEGFGLWAISHVPTGQQIATLPTQAAARQCIGLLATVDGLGAQNPGGSTLSEVSTIVSSLPSPPPRTTTTRSSRPSGKPRDAASPSSFSPVFRGYVPTPADRAAQNIAALSLGTAWNGGSTTDLTRFLSEAEQAAAIHAREEIVVRVTQPPRALLLETDIPRHLARSGPPAPSPDGSSTTPSLSPSSPATSGPTSPPRTGGPSSTATLRDGTPATPGEFRRRYQALLEIGDRLQKGSIAFSRVYAEGEASGWPAPLLEKWEVMDERFRAMACEGWMIWSGAAFCFDCAPEEFKRNVVKKLGFIGSREKGWHELGIKSFLRHPEVAAVAPLRREMKERIQARL
jgi:hypothetical protein